MIAKPGSLAEAALAADPAKFGLLQAALSAAVPLYIEELRHKPMREILELARECAQVIASKGDLILFRSKKAGETAGAFNALAKGLACGAFAVGGIRAFGLEFQATHPEQPERET